MLIHPEADGTETNLPPLPERPRTTSTKRKIRRTFVADLCPYERNHIDGSCVYCERDALRAEVERLRAQVRPVYKTSERVPTREDADETGCVLAWVPYFSVNNLELCHWRWHHWTLIAEHPNGFNYWQPGPPPPAPEEET